MFLEADLEDTTLARFSEEHILLQDLFGEGPLKIRIESSFSAENIILRGLAVDFSEFLEGDLDDATLGLAGLRLRCLLGEQLFSIQNLETDLARSGFSACTETFFPTSFFLGVEAFLFIFFILSKTFFPACFIRSKQESFPVEVLKESNFAGVLYILYYLYVLYKNQFYKIIFLLIKIFTIL